MVYIEEYPRDDVLARYEISVRSTYGIPICGALHQTETNSAVQSVI